MKTPPEINQQDSPPPVQIFEGGFEFLDDIMILMQSSFPATFGERWNIHQCRSMLALPSARVLLASHDDQICGFVISRTSADEMEILMIAVSPNHQNRGIGLSMLNSIFEQAERNHVARIFLEVRSNNPAQYLYRKLGFEKVGLRKDYYLGDDRMKYDAVTYCKKLSQ